MQELAFTLGDGFEYVRRCLERGLKVDDFAPRLSFFFNVCNDFFEEIAKFRAARKVWATEMRDTFGAQDPRSWWLRTHAQTSGAALTAQQPENNTVRVGLQALAAVLGGAQSLHTNSADEAWALPSEKAALTALRTQQIIAHETGVTDTVDPLGGSYFLETLTQQLADGAYDYFRKVEDVGGTVKALESGFLQREIALAAYQYQQELDRNQRTVVGVNDYTAGDALEIPILEMDREGEALQLRRLNEVRRTRDNHAVQAASCRLGSCRPGPAKPDASNSGRSAGVRHLGRGDGGVQAGVRGIPPLLGHMREGLLLEDTGNQRRRHQLSWPVGCGGSPTPPRGDLRGRS